MTDPIENQRSTIKSPPDAATGLPLLRSWPAVYAFILAVFILLVLALTLFTHHFTKAAS